MIPERIRTEWGVQEICRFAEKWRLDWNFAATLHRLTVIAQPELQGLAIRSGWRSCEEQALLERAGRPAAPCDVSTHTSCPVATGADMMLLIATTNVTKARFGYYVHASGLRWGGGGPADPETGIPLDWNHVDMGPRRTG